MVDGFSCILDFLGPPDPPYKGNTSIKQIKELESLPPLKQSTRNLSLGIQKLKKGGGCWGKIFVVWFVIGLFETLICAIAEDKVCNSCIVSSSALLIFLLCLWWPNSNFLCCVIMQNGDSSRDHLLSVTNRKGLAPGGGGAQPPRAPFKTFITLLPVTFSQLDPQLGVGWGKRLVQYFDRLSFNRWLKLFNCQIFSRLAFGIKGL